MDFLFKVFLFLIGIYQWWTRFYRQYSIWGILLIIISITAIVVGLVVSYHFYETLKPFLKIAEPGDTLDITATGMIGDFIGGVIGPIFSFVGVLLFFLALRLQSKELGLQIKELAETRSVFTTQQFENTFFNLLQTQQEIRLKLETSGSKDSKPSLFEEFRDKMFSIRRHLLHYRRSIEAIKKQEDISDNERQIGLTVKLKSLKEFSGIDDYEALRKPGNLSKTAYKVVFKDHGHQLGHYFRNLYHILSYLKENEDQELLQTRRNKTKANRHIKDSSLMFYLSKKQARGLVMEESKIKRRHKKYAAFVQAQMSSTELFLLFYNALFFPKMKALMHHFDFLENLNADDLLVPRDKQLYGEFLLGNKKYSPVILKSVEELLKIE